MAGHQKAGESTNGSYCNRQVGGRVGGVRGLLADLFWGSLDAD